uniref:F-box domain-containing protein n=1 Tax=Kalanchoe fedtschenkoi TaxID=63787 RepID=A0A7N0VKY8_KALFE
MTEVETLTPLLPDDIMVEVLSWLPARSLGRSSCVSKCWNSLIRSRRFIEMHLRRGFDTVDRLRLLYSPYPPDSSYSINFAFSIKCGDISKSFECVSDANVEWLTHPTWHYWPSLFDGSCHPPPDYFLSFAGCCNGLLCFAKCTNWFRNEFQAFLWNPATGALSWVSEENVAAEDVWDDETRPGPEELPISFRFGFGYDSVADDYKIVRLLEYYVDSDEYTRLTRMEVLSVGTNTLRRFEVRARGEFLSDKVVFLNGSLHWLLSRQLPSKAALEYFVLRFNLETEKMDEVAIQFPEAADSGPLISGAWGLRVLDGRLHVMVEYQKRPEETESEMWVLEECASSWTMKLSMPHDLGATAGRNTLYVSTDGGVLVEGRLGDLAMCDLEKQSFQKISFPDSWKLERFHYKLVFVESLISPFHVPNPNWRFEG